MSSITQMEIADPDVLDNTISAILDGLGILLKVSKRRLEIKGCLFFIYPLFFSFHLLLSLSV